MGLKDRDGVGLRETEGVWCLEIQRGMVFKGMGLGNREGMWLRGREGEIEG